MQDSFSHPPIHPSFFDPESGVPKSPPEKKLQLPLKLKQMNGQYPSRLYDLQGPISPQGTTQIIIGRSSSVYQPDISVNEPVVSRKHAELVFDGESLAIRHLSDNNPTYVNKESLRSGQTMYLKINDVITLANIELELVV